MFCVVSGAGAGYGVQQTGEFPHHRSLHIMSHSLHQYITLRCISGCMRMTAGCIFSISMSCMIENDILVQPLAAHISSATPEVQKTPNHNINVFCVFVFCPSQLLCLYLIRLRCTAGSSS